MSKTIAANGAAPTASDKSGELLFPLTAFDGVFDASGICVQYVLTPSSKVDVDKIEAAIGRVMDRWRVLAGRMVWLEERKIWAIRVPTGSLPPNYTTHHFTSTIHDRKLGFTPPALTPTTATTFAQPPFKHFQGPGTPSGNKGSQNKPIVSVHVGVFEDAAVVGVTFSHGIFDGVGFGHVLRAIGNEIRGKEWDVPELKEVNPVQMALEKVEVREGTEREEYKTFIPVNAWSVAAMLGNLAWQKAWFGTESRQLYLGRDVVEKIAKEVKEEVQRESGGTRWVSETDVVNAWVLKAAYLNEPNSPNVLDVEQVFDARPILSEASGTSFDTYPHNLILYSEFTNLPLSALASTRLSTLALKFRDCLTSARNLSHLRTRHYDPPRHLTFHRGWCVDVWGFSNQVRGGYDQVTWGDRVEVKDLVVNPVPINVDNSVLINKLDGGFIMAMELRYVSFDLETDDD
ncbi:hypothetical protein MNV49_001475 [Pseudohyphozyma bogoriensis]|nr:hypothetical protein MNV49_001475 [Pseudohyphozyma bogoriensis]